MPKRRNIHRGCELRQRIRAAVRLALCAGAGLGLGAPLAWSAEAGADDAVTEIVVTANRREQSITEIPYSITALSGEALAENHVKSLSDLTHMVPGVSFVDAGPTSRSNFVLRGINANSTSHPSVSTVAPVSTYIGETPLFLSLQIDDLDRVEVLRGPQGTLYGSGALAGTIRFIPNRPDPKRFEAQADIDGAHVAETKQYDRGGSGMINLPLGDTMAVRLAAAYQHYAGFINENYIAKLGPASTSDRAPVGVPVSGDPANPVFGPMVFTPIHGANTSDLWHARLSWLFKPAGPFSALFTYYHQDDRTHGVQAASPGFGGSVDALPADNPFYDPVTYPVKFPTGGVVFPQNGTYDTNDSFLLANHRHADLESLDLSFDFGFATATSSTSYYRDRGEDVSDGTGYITRIPQFYGFIPRMVDFERDYDDNRGFVEELRLVSGPGHHTFDYVVGFFLQHLTGHNGQTQWIPGQTHYSALAPANGGFAGSDAVDYGDTNYIVRNRTGFLDRALFGELTWHLTDAWQVTGGARVFKQDFSTEAYSALPYCGSFCGTGILGVTDAINGYAVNDHILKLNTSYRVSPELNAYANFSQGFRRGGANGIPITGPFAVNPALLVYTPDKADNYEFGVKGTRDGIAWTADAFWIDWKNFQVDTQSYLGGYAMAVNGPKARSRGIELSADGKLTRSLSLQLGYAFTDAKVARSFQILDNAGGGVFAPVVKAQSGDELPNSPRHTASAMLAWTHPLPLASGWQYRWQVSGSYRSGTLSGLLNSTPGTPLPFEIRGFMLWDTSLTLTGSHGLYTELYGRNLFNALAVTGGVDAGEVGKRAAQYYVGRPRTIGLRIGVRF